MSLVKICEHSETPEEGKGKTLNLEHPLTLFKYNLGLFKMGSKLFVITDKCSKCGGSLGRGRLQGLFAICSSQECLWNIKKGYCKFDHSSVLPTYKVVEQEDGVYINI